MCSGTEIHQRILRTGRTGNLSRPILDPLRNYNINQSVRKSSFGTDDLGHLFNPHFLSFPLVIRFSPETNHSEYDGVTNTCRIIATAPDISSFGALDGDPQQSHTRQPKSLALVPDTPDFIVASDLVA